MNRCTTSKTCKLNLDSNMDLCDDILVLIMAIRVVEFSSGGYKIRKVFGKESTFPKEIIEFLSFGLMASCQK